MKNAIIILFLTGALMLTGCQTGKKDVGQVVGGVLGGVVGSQIGPRGSNEKIAAIVGGTLLGAWVGGEFGAKMDAEDAQRARDAELVAYDEPIGKEVRWDNDRTGNHGTVTPVRRGNDAAGNECKEFRQTVVIEGRSETAYGTACRDDYGEWRIVNR